MIVIYRDASHRNGDAGFAPSASSEYLFTADVEGSGTTSPFHSPFILPGVTLTNRRDRHKTAQGPWRSLAPEQLREAVSRDRIDILIDLSGHTHSTELKQFAQRLAPVQATYLGYPGSTGVPNIDFLIGDSVLTPASQALLYSERLMRLDTSVFCYAPEENYPSPKFDEAMQQRPLTFGSFNNLPKITPETVDLWAQILQALPDARLLLKAPSFQDPTAVARIESLFSSRNIDPGRLTLRGPSELSQMMQEYQEVDIGLDPMPYNGGTTTLQALWMGVPVVTKSGHNLFRGWAKASCVMQI